MSKKRRVLEKQKKQGSLAVRRFIMLQMQQKKNGKRRKSRKSLIG